jgi:hypothetical protein
MAVCFGYRFLLGRCFGLYSSLLRSHGMEMDGRFCNYCKTNLHGKTAYNYVLYSRLRKYPVVVCSVLSRLSPGLLDVRPFRRGCMLFCRRGSWNTSLPNFTYQTRRAATTFTTSCSITPYDQQHPTAANDCIAFPLFKYLSNLIHTFFFDL